MCAVAESVDRPARNSGVHAAITRQPTFVCATIVKSCVAWKARLEEAAIVAVVVAEVMDWLCAPLLSASTGEAFGTLCNVAADNTIDNRIDARSTPAIFRIGDDDG